MIVFFKCDVADLKAFAVHFTLIACGSVSRQACASFDWGLLTYHLKPSIMGQFLAEMWP
jgi:hypothetical protein